LIIPDGTYTVGGDNVWEIDPAWSGLFTFDTGAIVDEHRAKSGTVTISKNADNYTVVIDAVFHKEVGGEEVEVPVKTTFTGPLTAKRPGE
jgi:hypothetical protein